MPSKRKGCDHGEFPVMHDLMLRKFQEWIDEFCEREHGFRVSKLQQIERSVAMLVTSETLTDEGIAERDRLLAEYKEVWRPRRCKLLAM